MDGFKYYIDAIKGATLNRTFCSKYIPKKYIVVSNNGDNLTFNVEKFVNDWSNENTINENTLKALHKIIIGDDVATFFYNNFDPRCTIQILFDKCEQEYVQKRMDNYVQMEKEKGASEAMSCALSDYINFGILHSLGCMYKNVRKVLVENNILNELCFVSKERMEELNEKLKTEQLFNTIKQITRISEEIKNIGIGDYTIKDVKFDEKTNIVNVYCFKTGALDHIDITMTLTNPNDK